MTFAVGVAGPVQLDYNPPLLLRIALVVQAALWVLAAGAAINEWRSRRRHLGELLAMLPPEDSRDAFEGAFSVERAFADDDTINLSPPPIRHRAPAHDPVLGGRTIRLRPRLRSVPTGAEGGAAVVPAAVEAEAAQGGPDDPVEGTLADEMWSRWTTRQGLRNHPERTRASDSRRSHDVIAGPGATGDPGEDQHRAGPPATPERKR